MSNQNLLLGAAGFIAVGTFRLSDPLLPKIAEEFGASISSVAVTVTAFTLGYALFQLLHGPLGDRVGKLRVITGMLAATALTTIGCGWMDTVGGLAALRFATGMTAGAIAPLAMAQIGDTVVYESRQATIAIFLMACLTGQMVAGSLAGVFAQFLGWRYAFVVFGAAGLIVAGGLWGPARRAPRPAPRSATGATTTHGSLLRERQTRIIWGAGFCEGCLTTGAVPYIGAYLKTGFDLDYAVIGLVLSSFGIGGIIYSLNVRWLVKRLGERGLVMTGGTLITVSYIVMAVAPVWQLLAPALTLIGLGFFCIHGILQLRATEIAPHARGTALAGFVFYVFLGQGAGVFALGFLVDGPGYRTAFAVTGITVVFFAAWLYRALFRARPAANSADRA